MHFISNLKSVLESPINAVIIPHKNPDGDALGSCLALYHYLKHNKHNAQIISPNEYPKFLNWLPGEEEILTYNHNKTKAAEFINNATVIFTLDFNSLDRTGNLEPIISQSAAKMIMIDHHQSPDDYAELMYSDTTMSSTCEMVYNVLKALDMGSINPAIASCLYTGIMTDTGSFRYPSTTASTHRAIAQLIDCGAQGATIHENIFDTASFDRLKLLGKTLSNLTKIKDLPVVYMTLTQSELNAHDYRKGDTEGFVNYGLSLLGIQVSIIMIENEMEGKIKMSFRSKGDFSVNAFAREHFSGGGHINAAGGMSMLSMQETVAKLVGDIRNYADQF